MKKSKPQINQAEHQLRLRRIVIFHVKIFYFLNFPFAFYFYFHSNVKALIDELISPLVSFNHSSMVRIFNESRNQNNVYWRKKLNQLLVKGHF